jgi:hypothetical protein
VNGDLSDARRYGQRPTGGMVTVWLEIEQDSPPRIGVIASEFGLGSGIKLPLDDADRLSAGLAELVAEGRRAAS